MDKDNIVCIYSGMLFSLKKEGILSFAKTWMPLEDIILSEMRQTQKSSELYDPIYIRNLNYSKHTFHFLYDGHQS